MRYGIFLLLLLGIGVSASGVEPAPAPSGGVPRLELSSCAGGNLLRNPGFEELDRNGNPKYWSFDNCSRSPRVSGRIERDGKNGHMAVVELREINSGYWTQPVRVEAGRRYHVQAEFRSRGPRCLLWIRTNQYNDGKSSYCQPLSDTDIISTVADPKYGGAMAEELANFIDSRFLCCVSPDKWQVYSHEFTVPEGHGIDTYFVKPGAYFGGEGCMMTDNVWFGPAEFTLTAKVSGPGIAAVRVVDSRGRTAAERPVAPNAPAVFRLPSRKELYTVEGLDAKRRVVRRERWIDENR